MFIRNLKMDSNVNAKFGKATNKLLLLSMIVFLILLTNSQVFARPLMDCTIFGKIFFNGTELTRNNDQYTVTLEVNGNEIASYKMGTDPIDMYSLLVKMDDDPEVTDKGHPDDSAYLYINGIAIDQNPVILITGNEILDISATTVTQIPDVTKKSEVDARTELGNAGFTVTKTEECNNDVTAGNVISQNPAGGTVAEFGTSVNLVISTGPCPVAVPSALNCDDITNADLVCNLIEQCDNSVAAGGVISQDPVAGTMVATGSTVTLVVSTGLCPREVANVTGISQGAAESAITDAGFIVGSVTKECSDTVEASNVISQNPAGGTVAEFGTSVNLVISTGPCPVAVPSALNCDDITNADLVCNLIEQCDNSVAAGGVISQDPVAGTMVATGSTVTLVISTGPCNEEPVAVDDDYSIDEDNTLDVAAWGVLDNDTDADDDTLTAELVSGPSNGMLSLNADGSFTYTPNANFNGEDSFTYMANDGIEDSNTAIVTITINPVNDPPVADAGPDQADVSLGDVSLDGSDSTDVDEDQITFAWTIINEPYAGAGNLVNANLVNPKLVVDEYGLYEVGLEVCDDEECHSDTVQIATEGNLKPVANAGEDKTVGQYDYVCLDGSASSDPNGDNITYNWTITSMPDGIEAMLDNSVAVAPCFTPNEVGDYMVQLIVNDDEYDSDSDTVTISVEGNSRPVADAAEDRDVNVGEEVCLNGSESSDPDGDNITYSWAITSRPVGSNANAANLDDPGTVNPCFTPDVFGAYLVQLTVTDEHNLPGEPVTVTITATDGEEPVPGDLNKDGIVDMADLNIILSHRNQPADICPECDLDGDGMITAFDTRKLLLLCTCPRCVCP